MSSRATRRTLRSRSSTRRSLRPSIDHLESRSLLTTTPLVAHPTFEIGPLTGGGGPAGGYTPAQVQTAYGFNHIYFGGVAGNGSGQTIAIVDACDDPNIQADLNAFDAQFDLPATTVAVYNETGGTSLPASDPTGGWELEESLDVEWAHAMAPGASIMLVEASSPSYVDLLTAVSYGASHANVVSMSWGGGEFSYETSVDSYFDQPGVVFVASSGDEGAPAIWPAVSPNVLSVGGTTLTLGANNVWSSEVGWCGSGGGPSAYESQPSYQQGVVTQTSAARAAPDVAYDADPSTGFAVYDSVPYAETTYDWLEVGGTSAGSPQWSALLAIADQGRAASGQPPIDSTSPQQVMDILYENRTAFHDITSGTSIGTPSYSAGTGYDYVTGLGSPIANLVVGSLDATAATDRLVLAAPTAEAAGTSFNLTVTAENSSGTTDTGYVGTVHFTSSDVQAGLPADFTFTAADAGTYTFEVTLKTAGSQSITATDTATSAITGTLPGISVSPATASQLVLSGLPSTTTAGKLQALTVTAEDPYGNVATGYGGTVQFTSSDPRASLPANFVFTAADQGVQVFTLAFETAGTQSMTVTDTASGITATQAGITVQAAAAVTFTVTGFPTAAMAGSAGNVVVMAYDAYGNVATGYTGTVSLTSSDPHADLPFSFTFQGITGTHTFAVTLETVGTQSITATDWARPSITGTESGILVRATPQVTWGPPAAIVYGTPLSAAQLDASANVPGRFTYHPAAGAILAAGAGQTLSVTFTPTDATDYTTATGTTTITVTQVTPTISITAPGGTFDGSPFAASATIAGVSGTPATSLEGVSPSLTCYSGAYSNPMQLAGLTPLSGATVQAGAYTVLASFPATADYAAATGLANFTIAQATPQVTWGPPAAIVYGTTLSAAQLDALANVPGTFNYTPAAGVILAAGAGQTLSVTFTPADGSDYTTATGTTTITVTQATPIISLTAPGGTFDGSPFAASVTIAGVSGTPGPGLQGVSPSLTYYSGTYSNPTQLFGLTPLPGAAVHGGAYTVLASFPATVDYAAATGLASFTIAQATPQVTWAPPAAIVYGTPLSAAQLDALANVPGTFTYTPAAGAILAVGASQTLSVTFTPTDAADYTTAAAATTIAVTKATPILKVTDAGGRFDGSPFPASATIAGVVAGVDATPGSSLDNVTPTLTYYDGSGTAGTSLGLTPPSAPGAYTVVAAFPGNVNYLAILSTPFTFTIGQGAVTLALASSNGSAVFGQPVSLLATVGAGGGTPSGTVAFFDGTTRLVTVPLSRSGTAAFTTRALSVGSHSITAVYSGDADFLGVQSAPYSEIVSQTGTEVVVVRNSVFNKKKLMSVRLTAEIEPLAPGGGVPTGEVTFEVVTTIKKKVKVTTLGTAALSGGEATLTLMASKLPQQGITIIYSGDANDQASTITTPRLT